MGLICEKQAKCKEAVDYYRRALEREPTLWTAFERLCKLKDDSVDPNVVFNEKHQAVIYMNQTIQAHHQSPNPSSSAFLHKTPLPQQRS